MKKSKLVSYLFSLILLTVLSLESYGYMQSGGDGPDKACILDSPDPEHSRLFCYGEGSYCSNLGDCLFLILE